MKFAKRVEQWVEAGIIDSASAARIMAHEESRRGLTFVTAMLGIGGLAIFLGIAAIVGVNWDRIPGLVKILVHALINSGIAFALYHVIRQSKTGVLVDLLAGVLAGLTFTFIALVGQIYQAQEPTWKALALWLVLITPFLLSVARSQTLMRLWVIALLATYGFFVGDQIEKLDGLVRSLMIVMPPLVMIAVGQTTWLRSRFDVAMTQLSVIGHIVMVAHVSLAQIVWRTTDQWILYPLPDNNILWEAFIISVVFALGIVGLRRAKLLIEMPQEIDILIVLSPIIGFLPMLGAHGDWPVIGAGIVMAYWGYCGWVGIKAGYRRALDVAVGFIALRLVIVYVEVFGSLLQTGVGLIVSGFLLIGLVLGLRRIFAFMKKEIV